MADKPWGLRARRWKKVPPEVVAFRPQSHGGEEANPEKEYVRAETNRDLLKILKKMSKEEKHKTRVLIALEGIKEGRAPKDVADMLGGWDKWQGLQDAAQRRRKNLQRNIEDVS